MGARRATPRSRAAAPADVRTWTARISSRAFKSNLVEAIRDEIESVADLRFAQLVDDRAVRRAIEAWQPSALHAKTVAGVAVHVQSKIESRLRKQRKPLSALIDDRLLDEIDALFAADLPSPEAIEDLVADVIHQEFVRAILADVIHSAIVSFNKKVNPLFGGIASAVLEDQIRGFIDLFMPMLQDQAVSFVLVQGNQRVVAELSRGVARTILAQPLKTLVPRTSAAHRRRIEALISDALANENVTAAARNGMANLWRDVYDHLGRKKMRVIIDPQVLADSIAEPAAELLTSVLSRPRIAALFAADR